MLESFVEYEVEIIRDDATGAINISQLSSVLRKYSNLGWKLKSVFTNELGKNSVSVAGIGNNSTLEQTILVFERSKFINNTDAVNMIQKYNRTFKEIMGSPEE